jgi:protein-S-isoprenylcysteine O-methyltransferase Ste14
MSSVPESDIRVRCPQYLVHLVETMATPLVHALHGFDDLPQMTTRTLIGILVAVTGNILISLALNLQKLAHKRVENRKRVSNQKQRRKLKDTLFETTKVLTSRWANS